MMTGSGGGGGVFEGGKAPPPFPPPRHGQNMIIYDECGAIVLCVY